MSDPDRRRRLWPRKEPPPYQTPTEKARAARQKEIDRQFRMWTPRRVVAWSFFGLAFVVAAQHMLAHLGWRPLPISMGWQDLLIGDPAAGVIAIIGALGLGARSTRQPR